MAVSFQLDDLTDSLKVSLAKELTYIPEDPYVEKMKKWGRPIPANRISCKMPVLMFDVNRETRSIKLPFYTASLRMDAKPNRHKKFPKLHSKGVPKFHAELREKQRVPAEAALAQLKEFSTTTLGLPPGFGKTILGAWLAGKANGTVLVLAHRIQICEAWVKTFRLCYPQYSDSILLVGENEFTDGIYTEDGELVPRFTISMDGRVASIPDYIKKSICTLIVDEAHLFCTPSRVECLLAVEPKFVIAETATLNRPDGMERMIQSIVGPHGVFQLSDKPHRVYILDTGISVPTIKGARGTDFTDLTIKLQSSEMRNDMILDCVRCNMHRKIMIQVRQKNHVLLLEKLLQDNGISVATLFGSQKEYSDSHVLIGTIPKMGVGFDEQNSCPDFLGVPSNLLILVTSIAQIELFEQVRGRVMRSSDPAVLYFRDDLKIVEGHINNVSEWIELTKGTIHQMNYQEGEMRIPDMIYDKEGIGHLVPVKKKKLVLKNPAPPS
jgi:hypothetical protein